MLEVFGWREKVAKSSKIDLVDPGAGHMEFVYKPLPLRSGMFIDRVGYHYTERNDFIRFIEPLPMTD